MTTEECRAVLLQRVRVWPDEPGDGMTYPEIVNSLAGRNPAAILFGLRDLVESGELVGERPKDGGPMVYREAVTR